MFLKLDIRHGLVILFGIPTCLYLCSKSVSLNACFPNHQIDKFQCQANSRNQNKIKRMEMRIPHDIFLVIYISHFYNKKKSFVTNYDIEKADVIQWKFVWDINNYPNMLWYMRYNTYTWIFNYIHECIMNIFATQLL